MKPRQRSVSRSAPAGGLRPVRRSRASIATASSSGASSRERASANGLLCQRSSSMAARLAATPSMRREPIASTRACSTASNRARAAGFCGARRRWTASLWQASRRAKEFGDSAQDRRFARTGLARRLGQARLGPLRPGHQRRLVGGEGDFKLGIAGERPRAGGDRQLERVVRRVGLAARLAVAGRFDVDGGHEGLYASGGGPSQGNGSEFEAAQPQDFETSAARDASTH